MAQSQQARSDPRLRAGLDEAGLGPLLGPYALGMVVLETPAGQHDAWRALAPLVGDGGANSRARLHVADSKRLYDRSARGGQRLERTARAFAAAAGMPPWRLDPAAPPHWRAELNGAPLWASSAELDDDRAALADALARAGVRVLHAQALLVSEGDLNRAFATHGNKARAVWSCVAQELRGLWERHGEREPEVVLDRQGGRTRYAPLLAAQFPEAEIEIGLERAGRCEYRLLQADSKTLFATTGARSMRIAIEPRAEQASFEVALASCLAKYAREACMHAFNAYFARLDPALRPTAGYVQDARRWLLDARECLSRAGLSAEELVRSR